MSTAVKEQKNTLSDSPSMEEILLSIRGVIAGIKDPQAISEFNSNYKDTAKDNEEEILELTEIVDEQGNKLQNSSITAKTQSSETITETIYSEAPIPVEHNYQNIINNNASSDKANNNKNTNANQTRLKEADPNSFLNEQVAKKTSQALANLVAQISSQQVKKNTEVQKATTNPSLESLVVNILTPQLTEWMNNNLPTIVEKLVEKEIKQLVKEYAV